MKNMIAKTITGLALIVAIPFAVRSCSIAQSKRLYLEGEFQGAHYSFARNGLRGKTYTITSKEDGTILRCDDLSYSVLAIAPKFISNVASFTFTSTEEDEIIDSVDIIDSVLVYNPKGNVIKVYENKLGKPDENDEFLTELTDRVSKAEKFIREEQNSQLLGKLNDVK